MSSAALEAPEAFDGFQYPRGDPAQHHLAAGATEQALGGIPITLRGDPMREPRRFPSIPRRGVYRFCVPGESRSRQCSR